MQARTGNTTPADVEHVLYDDRTLVRMLGMRRTLWVVPRELVPVVQAACTRTVAVRERRRLEQAIATSGISKRPAAWLARAERAALAALDARGEASTRELVQDVPLLGKQLTMGAGRWEIQQSAGARVLQLAMEGQVVRGRPRSGQHRWVPVTAWLGAEIDLLEPERARAELLRAWLARFGPATETDIRWWAGWTAREARAAIGAVSHDVVDLDGAAGYVLEGDLDHVEPEPSAALLSTLDPTTMGWKERDWYLGSPDPPSSTRMGTRARPSGGRAGWSVAGRSARTVRSCGACSRKSAPTPSARSRRRPSASSPGSATCASNRLPSPFQRALARGD